MPRLHPSERIIESMHRMSGAAQARDIALEAGIERAEVVQHLRRLRVSGLVMVTGIHDGRFLWLVVV